MGPAKTIVDNFTELSSSSLELEGWIVTWAVGGVLPNFIKWSQLQSSLPTPAGSNLTLWSWQQLFCPAPNKKNLLVQIYKNFHEKFRTYTVIYMIFRLVHKTFLMQTPYWMLCCKKGIRLPVFLWTDPLLAAQHWIVTELEMIIYFSENILQKSFFYITSNAMKLIFDLYNFYSNCNWTLDDCIAFWFIFFCKYGTKIFSIDQF